MERNYSEMYMCESLTIVEILVKKVDENEHCLLKHVRLNVGFSAGCCVVVFPSYTCIRNILPASSDREPMKGAWQV